jgi:phosphatidate phosphatase LPIN
MDIIAIQYPDGNLKSSPFHVRFGTLKILKTREKTINIYVNNIKTDLTMRLSSSGDAYFLQEVKKVKEENEEVENNSSDGMGSPVNRRSSAPDSPNLSPFTKRNKEDEKMNGTHTLY